MMPSFFYSVLDWLAWGYDVCAYVLKRAYGYIAENKKVQKIFVWIVFAAFLGMVFYSALFAAPAQFPAGTLLHIKKGSTVSDVAALLKQKHVIHSEFLFDLFSRMYKNNGAVIAGEYSLGTPQGVLAILGRLTTGDFEVLPVRIRILDGASALQISQQLKKELPDFDSDTFYTLAEPQEGHLFPDTYFFLPGDDPDLVLSAMTGNFNTQIHAPAVATAIATFGKPLDQVLVMASILEREAPDTQNRRLIAGILWKRISLGIPLQVDAVFPYIIGKNSFNLTKADLQYDSPYNTYLHKGLPPGPIGNPSIDSILAVVKPLTSSYLYYLSDRDGNMYFSTTYAQHLAKVAKYLTN